MPGDMVFLRPLLELFHRSAIAVGPIMYRGTTHIVAVEQEVAAIMRRSKIDRKSTRLNSSHVAISYAVFCLKKKKKQKRLKSDKKRKKKNKRNNRDTDQA